MNYVIIKRKTNRKEISWKEIAKWKQKNRSARNWTETEKKTTFCKLKNPGQVDKVYPELYLRHRIEKWKMNGTK